MGVVHFARSASLVLALGLLWAVQTSAQTNPTTLTVDLPGLDPRFTKLDMILVPAGGFGMGAPAAERGRSITEGPRHTVYISQPYYLGKYEVTQAQWESVMGENPAYHAGDGDKPIELVSWLEIQDFISRLNKMGLGTFRLPTEAEWEYACRAGTTTRFSYGDALDRADTECVCPEGDAYMWFCGNNVPDDNGENYKIYGSKPVGKKLPNRWGFHDMHGNVWEWVSDWYGYYSTATQTDPKGPDTGVVKVLRGGMWNAPPILCRTASRGNAAPEFRHIGMGFRLVRTTAPVDRTPPPPVTPMNLPSMTVNVPNLPQGSTPLQMLLIPAGTFTMGSDPAERGHYEDELLHEVTLTKPFWMGKFEVTQAQYQAVMGTNPSGWPGPNRPVEMITWSDAQAFITKLNTLGLGVFRFPTEAEWEYACRAGTTTRYFYGDALDCPDRGDGPCPTADLYSWHWGNYEPGGSTHDVGLKLPNPFGLHDMHGNVWEWVGDWYGPYPTDPQIDPKGPAAGNLKILRGGMYRSNGRMMRSAFRDHVWPSFLYNRIGMRLVREP